MFSRMCPDNNNPGQYVEMFAADNTAFLNAFKKAWQKMQEFTTDQLFFARDPMSIAFGGTNTNNNNNANRYATYPGNYNNNNYANRYPNANNYNNNDYASRYPGNYNYNGINLNVFNPYSPVNSPKFYRP
eukprot:g19788.t1